MFELNRFKEAEPVDMPLTPAAAFAKQSGASLDAADVPQLPSRGPLTPAGASALGMDFDSPGSQLWPGAAQQRDGIAASARTEAPCSRSA